MQEKIKVLVVEPDKRPKVREIPNTLEAMQEIVGGYIEVAHPWGYVERVALVCNEEGKIRELPINRTVRTNDGKYWDTIFGTFFLAGEEKEDFASLDDNMMNKYGAMFYDIR